MTRKPKPIPNPKPTPAPIRAGIGGWTFPPWRGPFYPPGLPHAQELAYAATHVTAIEINATFYGRQKPESFARWRDATPESFVFAVKASRFTTHKRDLAAAGDGIAAFLASGITTLGPKLGPILWQFPPTRAFDKPALAAFLAHLPPTQDGLPLRHVVEARHPTFADPAWFTLLRDHNVAHAIIDSDKHTLLGDLTADFAYARLERNDAASPEGYDTPALDAWAARAQAWSQGHPADLPTLTQAPQTPRETLVFFIGGEKQHAPQAARAFLARLPTPARPGRPGTRGPSRPQPSRPL